MMLTVNYSSLIIIISTSSIIQPADRGCKTAQLLLHLRGKPKKGNGKSIWN
jgi:hypothetical protein